MKRKGKRRVKRMTLIQQGKMEAKKPSSARKAVMRYWRHVINDKSATHNRRDNAARSLGAFLMQLERNKIGLEKRKVIKQKLKRKDRTQRIDSAPVGKKAQRKVEAAEVAKADEWSGLINKAQVLPFRGKSA